MEKDKRRVNWGRFSTSPSGYTVHRITARRDWKYEEHGHRGYGELVCVTHGELKQAVNGQEIAQKTGEIVFIREADYHSLSGSNFSYVNVMFAEDWLKRLESYIDVPGLTHTLLSLPNPPRTTVPKDEIAGVNESLQLLLEHSNTLAGRRIFSQFLLNVITRYMAPLQDHAFPDDLADWLRDTLVWLHENQDRNISLQELVKRSYRSHEHFTREFSRHVGTTPSRYLADMKINRAAHMLLTTNHTLLEIAEAVGFENDSYFFRRFRQSKGCTPLAYRRTYGRNSIQKTPGMPSKQSDS